MSILEDHNKLVEAMKIRHRQELDELDAALRVKQQSCRHRWEKREGVFFAFGEPWPGEYCPECGATRHIKR